MELRLQLPLGRVKEKLWNCRNAGERVGERCDWNLTGPSGGVHHEKLSPKRPIVDRLLTARIRSNPATRKRVSWPPSPRIYAFTLMSQTSGREFLLRNALVEHGRDMVGTSDCLAETTLATRGKKVPFQKKTFFRAASRQSSFRETV